MNMANLFACCLSTPKAVLMPGRNLGSPPAEGFRQLNAGSLLLEKASGPLQCTSRRPRYQSRQMVLASDATSVAPLNAPFQRLKKCAPLFRNSNAVHMTD